MNFKFDKFPVCVIFSFMMWKLVFIGIIIIFLTFPVLGFSLTGETGGVENIFSYGAGLRALGMGGAFTAIAGDSSLVYWNPGAMSFNQYKEISLFGLRTIADSYYVSGFYTNPTVSLGALGIGGLGIYTSGIESYDSNGAPITTEKNTYLHYQILLSYGYNFKWGLGLGSTVKIEQVNLLDYTGTGASFDIGLYFNPKKPEWLSLGAVVQDVYGTGIKLGSEYEKNTRIYKIGIGANFKLGTNKKTSLIFDLDGRMFIDNYNPSNAKLYYDLSLGSEVNFSDRFMIRAGYREFEPQNIFKSLPQGLTFGIGIRQWGFGIDYAVSFEDPAWQGTVELLMRLGLSYRFGLSIDEKKRLEKQKIKQEIQNGIRKATEKYQKQLEELSTKYELEKQRVIQELEQEYQEKISKIDQTIEKTRQEIIADLTAQFEAEKNRALEELKNNYEAQRAALENQLRRERSTYEQQIATLQRRYEEEKRVLEQKIVADETFKSEKYAKALELYAAGNYEDALAELDAIARFDPNYLDVQEYINKAKAATKDVRSYPPEIMNIFYRGIDLFVQKKYEEAIAEWQKILEIDPYNQLALRNIKEAEQRLRKLRELKKK